MVLSVAGNLTILGRFTNWGDNTEGAVELLDGECSVGGDVAVQSLYSLSTVRLNSVGGSILVQAGEFAPMGQDETKSALAVGGSVMIGGVNIQGGESWARFSPMGGALPEGAYLNPEYDPITYDINVAQDIVTGVYGELRPSTNPRLGGSVGFAAKNVTIHEGTAINAWAKGYEGGDFYGRRPPYVARFGGYGPGAGMAGSGASYGGYGARGTGSSSAFVPALYGDENHPNEAGSGGGAYGDFGGFGGGLVYLVVDGTVTLDGIINANGESRPLNSGGGGSGGGVYIYCKTLRGGENAFISADGGNPSMVYEGGAGGGGRVAVWYRYLDFDTAKVSVAGGVGKTEQTHTGTEGTVVFKVIPPSGTLILVR